MIDSNAISGRSRINLLYISFFIFLLSQGISLYSQVTFHGTVTDTGTGEVLIGATVMDSISGKGAVTNEYGYFSLTLPEERVHLVCSFIGYSPARYFTKKPVGGNISFDLEPDLQIDEVTITSSGGRMDLKGSQMSFHNINAGNIKSLPILLGEKDMVKALQYLPGVSSGMEGTSGIFVRGGGPDQNLILLDDVPVYNVNHLFGFFSVFNGEAINNVSLYKAGYPARYSGRLSSVIDVRMKEGNNQEFHGSASIGLISSDLTLEGPIIKDQTSFLVSARRTYIDILSYPVQYAIHKIENTSGLFGYYFQDLNAKVNHKFSDKSRLYFSNYAGKDEFYLRERYTSNYGMGLDPDKSFETEGRMGFNWGNLTSSLRWNYIWGPRFFSNFTASFSKYRFNNFEGRTQYFEAEHFLAIDSSFVSQKAFMNNIYYSGIRNLALKADFSFIPGSSQTIRFGLKSDNYLFEPGAFVWEYDFEFAEDQTWYEFTDSIQATALTGYIEDEFKVGDRFRANIGLSSTWFRVQERDYFSLEPRASASFLLSDRVALKASYAKMSQHVHLLTNATVGLPTDIWVPTTKDIPPEESWQVASGIHVEYATGWNFSIEGFYKEMKNLLEYSEGAELVPNDPYWQTRVEVGDGTAYGAEFFLEKTTGKFKGTLGYTLSKNTRTFENLNNGEPFPYKYDRRHDLSLTMNYSINDRISMNAVWVYASGVRTTVQDQTYVRPTLLASGWEPDSEYGLSERDLIRNFEIRNGYQLPNYHRLDIGFSFEKQKKKFLRTWYAGFYNTYNRKNAFYLYSSQGHFQGGGLEKRVYQVSMFPIIPYVRYSIKF